MKRQTTILKMLLKNKGMPVNREGESEDREKAQRLIKTEDVKTQHCCDSIVDSINI
ncbi:hypothetical protein Hanom_Chr03g00225861 [Helianthus anomalus]